MRTKNQVKLLLAIIICVANLLIFVPTEKANAVAAVLSTNLTVTNDGYETGGTYGFGTAVGMSTGAASMSITAPQKRSWGVSNTTATVDTINYVRARYNSMSFGNTYQFFARINNVNYYSPSYTTVTVGGDYYESHTWTTSPATGIAWTKTEIDNTEFGVYSVSYTTAFTYFYIIMNYNEVGYPTMDTSAVTNIAYSTNHTATLNGVISLLGGAYPSIRGFVYDTATHSDPGNLSPAASAYSTNSTESGNFTTGAYTRNLQSLTKGTTYYVRACAYNSYGWAYSSEISFTTLNDPAITTVASSLMSTTTSRLNSLVNNSGSQLADVRFGFGTATGNMTTYTNLTAWVNNTYTTGTTPYVDLTGLTANTTYYFRAEIKNDVSTTNGTELSFNTTATASYPTLLTANPAGTTVSLTWVKGAGSSDTVICYKTGTYPVSRSDGTLAYNGTDTSCTVSGLTSGETYYFTAWGKSGSLYSSGNATAISSTTAASADASPMFTGTATPSLWYQAPDYTKMSAMPVYGLFNWWSDAFAIPRSTFWFLLAMAFAIGVGVIIYALSHNVIAGSIAVTVCVIIVAIMGLMSYWMLLPFLIASVTIIMVGQRA
jgi:hypothetical protein